MLTTRHYHLNTSLLDWDLAHIFEHVIILEAKSHLARAGYPIDLFGWISGETFEDQLFIDAGFYQTDACTSFEEFMISKDITYQDHIAEAVSMIEAEEKSVIDISPTEIVRLLPAFDTLHWNSPTPIKPRSALMALSQFFTKSAKDFRDLSIVVAADELTPDEQKIFSRLRPILIDIVSHKLSQELALYRRGASAAIINSNTGKFLVVITTRRQPGRLTQLESLITNHIQTYPLAKNWVAIKAHFEAFATEPLWSDTPTEYFRTTGIVTTTSEICKLATEHRIDSIFSKVQIRIRTASAYEKSLIV